MTAPLDNLVVLDLTHALAGPYCTMLMASYGARVYKVEGVDTGDMGRTWGPPFQGPEASFFFGVNSGKKALAIDLKDPEGLALVKRIAARADVLIENMRPGALQRLGLGYGVVRELNPRLIYCSISGYGQTGPSRDEPAFDLILQAACGLISVTGTPGGATARSGHSVADITAGMFALIGVLMALEARHRTGVGQFIDVSMLDSMISAMASNFAYLLASGVIPGPQGTAFATIVPYRTIPAKDREITIAVASEKLWELFCVAIERPDLTEDPRYATNALRVANRNVLEPLLMEIFARRTGAEWITILRKYGIPCTPVRNLQEVVDDPQAAVREMILTRHHATAGDVRVTGLPVKMSGTPGEVGAVAPMHAEHTRQALRDLLGLADAELDALAARRVIA